MQDLVRLSPPDQQPDLNAGILALVADSVICTDEDGRILVFNQAAEQAFGYTAREVLGRPVELLLPLTDRTDHAQQVRGFVMGLGPPNRLMGRRREVRGRHKNGEIFLTEAMVSRQTIAGRMILTAVHRDITERKALEEVREAAARELDHRMKNVLSIVNSLVSISAVGAVSVEDFQASLSGRLKALAATQKALRFGEQSASLSELILAELAQYRTPDGANVVIQGPSVPLGPKAAQLLALAVHELATNATKYGALTAIGGCVTVTCALEGEGDDGFLVIRWQEAGGPTVNPPKGQGFGTRLIRKVVAKALKAEVTMDYRPEGLICRMAVPRTMLEPAG